MGRRVAVTGMGWVTPLGCDLEMVWGRVLEGRSGIRRITRFDSTDLKSHVAGEVREIGEEGLLEGEGFEPLKYLEPKRVRRMDRFARYAHVAAAMAMEDSGWEAKDEEAQDRAGVMMTSGVGGLEAFREMMDTCRVKGPGRVSPFSIPSTLINISAASISMEWGLRGPLVSHVGACASSAQSIASAAQSIILDETDMVVAGGAESPLLDSCFAGFLALRAMTTIKDEDPEMLSRPFDKARDGFVMSEGAAAVILEEMGAAKARGAKIYGEVAGWSMTSDAYHETAPDPSGRSVRKAMATALKRADLSTSQVGYVNAHATSTPLGDPVELTAMEKLFGGDADGLPTSSVKSGFGHMLGAAGAVEAITTLKALETQTLPPTAKLRETDIETSVDLVKGEGRDVKGLEAALSNSFGFGGVNTCLAFKRV